MPRGARGPFAAPQATSLPPFTVCQGHVVWATRWLRHWSWGSAAAGPPEEGLSAQHPVSALSCR